MKITLLISNILLSFKENHSCQIASLKPNGIINKIFNSLYYGQLKHCRVVTKKRVTIVTNVGDSPFESLLDQ